MVIEWWAMAKRTSIAYAMQAVSNVVAHDVALRNQDAHYLPSSIREAPRITSRLVTTWPHGHTRAVSPRTVPNSIVAEQRGQESGHNCALLAALIGRFVDTA